jgi:predicted nucleic acid-binding protein
VSASVVFVDTTAWYALLDRKDAHHASAKRFQAEDRRPFATSNYVVDELLTLTKRCLGADAAVRVGGQIFAQQIARLYTITPDLEQAAWGIFQRFADKGFSFTDCTSFALMEHAGIDAAFAFDVHFRQYGRFTVLP